MTPTPRLQADTLRTPGEAARELQISPATLARWATNGIIRPVVERLDVRLYDAAEVAELAAAREATR